MKTEDLEDVKFYNTFSPSGTNWDRDPKVTRYMTLPSLLSLLHHGMLHFSKLSDLRAFDRHEGVGGLMNNIIQTTISSGSTMYPAPPAFEAEQAAIVARVKKELEIPYEEQLPKFRAQVAKWDQENANVYVSSWHENVGDTDFMWRVYSHDDHGVAVVSCAQDLVHSFVGVDLEKIGFGFVAYPYRDELTRDHPTEGHFAIPPFLIKTKSFEPEREFRVFVKTKTAVDSCDMEVNLKKLIHEVRISPLAAPWIDEAVRATLNPICEKLGIPLVAEREQGLRKP
jgi:hypothetical protein